MSVSSGGARRLPGHRNRLQQHQQQKTANTIGQRSQSLSALQPVMQPRMAQLETLEAKMASIEVSLSSATPRRKKCLPLGSPSPRGFHLASSNPIIATTPATLPIELEGLRNALRDKENIIKNLRGQITTNNNVVTNSNKLNTEERKHLEDRIQRLKQDTDSKRHTIKTLKVALDKLDITDNIDIRIQQAELEYQLGREELNLLTLLEETRSAQSRLEDSNVNVNVNAGVNNGSVHALVTSMGGCARLLALEVCWSAARHDFGTAVSSDGGIFIEWCDRDTGLKKGDRIVEINGKLLITRTPPSLTDLKRLFSLCPNPAQLLILRSGSDDLPSQEVASLRSELGLVRDRAEEAQRAKDGLRADNLRLTHRISYLEEQVNELLETRRRRHHRHHQPEQIRCSEIRVLTTPPTTTNLHNHNQNVTNINIGHSDIQVFQKGPQSTTLLPQIEPTELSSRRRTDVRSVKSLDLDSDYTTSSPRPRKALDYMSEPLAPVLRKRPTPPKKPVRLSLHRAQSLQNVEPQGAHLQIPETRKRSREKSISGLRWPQQQTARWC